MMWRTTPASSEAENGVRPACALVSVLALCVCLVLPVGCKKSPPGQGSVKSSQSVEDPSAFFVGDPESLAEFQNIQQKLQKQEYPAALEGLEKMNARSAGASWAEIVEFTLAQTYMMTYQYRKALDLFDRFLRQHPSSASTPKALLYTGQIYMAMGGEGSSQNEGDSVSPIYFEKAIGLFKRVITNYSSDKELCAQAQYMIGSSYASLGDSDRAISAFEIVDAQYKGSSYSPKAMYRIAGEFLRKGDIEGAEAAFGKLTVLYPNSNEAQKARKKMEGIGLVGSQAFPLTISEWIGEPPGEISSLQGNVVLLSFWAIWCPHCRKNIPRMDSLVQRYAGRGLVVVGISRERPGNEVEKIREFIATHPMRFPTGIDQEGKTSSDYDVSDIPCLVVIDKKGIIRWHGHPDYVRTSYLEMLLAE